MKMANYNILNERLASLPGFARVELRVGEISTTLHLQFPIL